MATSERLRRAADILKQEAAAVAGLVDLLDDAFDRVVDRILASKGQVVVTGVGKPYIVAQKISASLASTGTPSIVQHPVDALHGDLGRICADDVVIAISNSGASEEVVRLLPVLKEIGVFIIALTGNRASPLADQADEVLDIGRIAEPCPLGLAPTSSTTAMMALGDALTLVLMEVRGFRAEDYAKLHPGGALGRRLMSVGQAMRSLEQSAVATTEVPLLEVLGRITTARSGAAFIIDGDGKLVGIFTDGDLRRVVADRPEALNEPVEQFMTRNPKDVLADRRVSEAVEILRHHQIDELPVVDGAGRLLGHLDVQDLLDGA